MTASLEQRKKILARNRFWRRVSATFLFLFCLGVIVFAVTSSRIVALVAIVLLTLFISANRRWDHYRRKLRNRVRVRIH